MNGLDRFRIPSIRGHLSSSMEGDVALAEPLSPHLIHLIGADNPFPSSEDFDPGGDWTQHYRVWTNHGHSRKQNKNTGHISIMRSSGAELAEYALRQVIVNAGGMFQRLEARIECSADGPGWVRQWEMRSDCYDAAQCPMDELALDVAGSIDDTEVRMTVNGVEETHRAPGGLLAQWLIPDTIQRGHGLLDNFSILEHGLKCKSPHALFPAEPDLRESVPGGGTLARTIQRGWGLLPWEYWQDSAGRVLYAFSGTVMHILDDGAPLKTERLIEELVQGGRHYEY